MDILVLDGDGIDPEIKPAILRELETASAGFRPRSEIFVASDRPCCDQPL
jgi:isocitrate/isopropylmalate dehydrogenase